MMTRLKSNDGFTLIEALVAMVMLVVGVITLYAMHTVAIRGNSTANTLSASTNLGIDTVEQLVGRNYNDALLQDGAGTNDGCAGLDDVPNADFGPFVDGIYTIYWNVATDCTLTEVPTFPDVPLIDSQRPKHIRVMVVRNIRGEDKQIAFNYIKQNNNL